MFYKNCQQKTHNIILHIITELIIPIKSPISAAINTNLIFFIPTTLVYKAIVYNVVSVDPIIVEVIIPQLTINTILFHNVASYSNRRTTVKLALLLLMA